MGFLPLPANQSGSIPSGIASGTMSGTNTIYSQIIEKSRMDNVGATVSWSGTAVGTLSVLVSTDGVNFNALTGYSPTLQQPAGIDGGYAMNHTQLSSKYIMFQYVNASGAGILKITLQFQDLN